MPDDPAFSPCWQMQFSWEGDSISLVDFQSVDMTASASDDIEGYEGHSGFWFELRGAGGTLYRRVIEHPLQPVFETPTDDGSLMRSETDTRAGYFQLTVPQVAGAQTLALVGSPPDPGSGEPARDLATFDLTGGQEPIT